MSYTIYNATTGAIVFAAQTVDAPPELADNQAVVDFYCQGQYFYIDIDTQRPVRIPTQPGDGLVYTFNFETKTHDIDLAASVLSARNIRDLGLSRLDRMNPLWYASLTSEQQQDLANYRLALLAVPQQEGFPQSINWPAKPVWL
jgi:hypothetical protein